MKNEKNCLKTPLTCVMFEKFPEITSNAFGQVTLRFVLIIDSNLGIEFHYSNRATTLIRVLIRIKIPKEFHRWDIIRWLQNSSSISIIILVQWISHLQFRLCINKTGNNHFLADKITQYSHTEDIHKFQSDFHQAVIW